MNKNTNKLVIGVAAGVLLIMIAAAAFIPTKDLRAYSSAAKSMKGEAYSYVEGLDNSKSGELVQQFWR